MSEATPVVEAPTPSQEATPAAPAAKASPAQDLRDIQALLVQGIFPGNAAPAIVKAYQLLDRMAGQVENGSK